MTINMNDFNNMNNEYDKVFGAGAYNSGLQSARNAGALKAQANFAKRDAMKRLSAQQAAAKKAATAAAKPTFQDALNYWNDPANKKDLLQKGAYRKSQEYTNDPLKRQELKSLGFNQKDFIDAMYNASSNGQYASKGAYDQFASQLAKDTKASNKAADAKSKADPMHMGMGVQDYYDYQQTQKTQQKKQAATDLTNEKNSLLGKLHLTSHTKQDNPIYKAFAGATPNQDPAIQSANNVLLAMHNDQIQRDVANQGVGSFGQELKRGIARGTNELSFGLLGQLDKNLHGGEISPALTERKGTSSWIDKGSDLAGSALPFIASDGILGGVKGIAKLGEKGLAGKVGELAVRGAGSGAMVNAGQQGVRYGFNPQDFNASNSAKELGLNAAFGAVANPVLHGAGQLLGKALGKALGKGANPVTQAPPTQELLGLPAPQLRLNAPQLQLPGPKPIIPSLEALNRAGIKPNGLQSPIPPVGKDLSRILNENQPHGTLADKLKHLSGSRTMADFSNSQPVVKGGLTDRLQSLPQDRQMPDFNHGKPSIERNNLLQGLLKGKQRPMADFSNSQPVIDSNITNAYGISTPFDPMEHATSGYWTKRYEDFANYVNSNYDTNHLSKAALEDLWSQFAHYNEPVTLDKLAELAYKDTKQSPVLDAKNVNINRKSASNKAKQIMGVDKSAFELPNKNKPINTNDVWNQMGNRPTTSNKAKKIMDLPKNVDSNPKQPIDTSVFNPKPKQAPTIKDFLNQDPRIKELAKGFHPPVRTEPKISRPATLDEMVNHLKELTPPKQTPVEPSPLQFRVNKGFNPKLQPKILNRETKTNGSLVPKPKQSLAFPTILRSVKTKKTVNSMSVDELNNVYKQLEQKHSALSKGKGNEQKLAVVQEDMDRVKKFLDLQFFGAKAPKEPLIPKSKAGSTNINPAPKGKNADITAPNPVDEHGYGLADTQALSSKTVKTLQESKDIMPNQTLTKNIYELVDRLPKEIGNKIKTSLDTAKVNHVNNLEQRSTDLYNKMVKDLGINKGSKESALVQDYGEKTLAKNYLKKQGTDLTTVSPEELDKINLEQLQKKTGKWQNIVEADKYFRENYKKMINEVNTTVKQIYPNNPDKIVPERSDYYHHFNQLDGFEGFKNLIQNSSAIDPHLAGISPNTKPNSKWQAFKQMRGNGEYKSDAVGGYLKYLQAASHSTHIDPMIKVLRQSADQVATATEGTKNLNNLKTALEVHADNLAGKTNPIDRLFQDHIIGRKNMQIVNVVNSHIKKNLILGNLGSALGQVGSVPLAIGKAKLYAPQGLTDTLAYTANHLLGGEKNISSPIRQSPWLKERFSGKYFTRFDNGLLKKPEKMAAWLLETADKSGTYFTWHSMYRKGLAKGVADPIKFADTETRHIIAGRGVGEVPIAQRAKVTQLVAPFSLEVGNQWKVLGKQMNEKDFAGVVTFLAASYGLNTVMNQIKGSGVSYNPVGAVADGYKKADGTTTDKLKGAGANLLGETVGNIPGGAYLPQILGLTSPKTKQALFGNRSPDRFGTGVGVASTVFKPAMDLIGGKGFKQTAKDLLPIAMPFGGNQAKKTVNGIEALAKGGSFDTKGNLQYPVDANKKSDLLHSLLLGPTTTAKGQDYYDNNRKPLSAKQTSQYQNAPNKQDYYNNLMSQRQVSSIQKKIKDTQKDQSLTLTEKQQNILILLQELQKLQK